MVRRIVFGSLITLALSLPLYASALSVDELQAQINTLLGQLKSLQEQLRQLQKESDSDSTPTPQPRACTMEAKVCPDGTSVGRTGPNCEFTACPTRTTPPLRRCYAFDRILQRGMRGDDVRELQEVLSSEGYLAEDNLSGYFGPVTEEALRKLQSANGVVSSGGAATTGWGVLGPMTRAWFWKWCGGVRDDFSASPTSGSAPLTVSFSAKTKGAGTYYLDFGDGSSKTLEPLAGICVAGDPSSPCNGGPDLRVNHVYTSEGAFTAVLSYGPACSSNVPCAAVIQKVGSATIRVGGSSGGNVSISGVEGPTTLRVGQEGTWKVNTSAPAGEQLRYSVFWGDETAVAALNAYAGNDASVRSTGTFTHVYSKVGAYSPKFTVSSGDKSASASASVKVGDSPNICPMYSLMACPAGYEFGPGTTNENGCWRPGPCVPKTSGTLSASPTSGSAPLTVTFRTTAGDEESFSVDFGDGTSAKMGVSEGGVARAVSHIYTRTGTYTAQLVSGTGCSDAAVQAGCLGVSRLLGSVTITVNAGTVACSQGSYLSLDGRCLPAQPQTQPGTDARSCPSGYTLTFSGQCTPSVVVPSANATSDRCPAGSYLNVAGFCAN